MNNNYIGVFDSGIGGLSTLYELRKRLPNENFFYFGDTKNNPYGEKTQEELEKIVFDISNVLVNKESVKLIVVACNTATTRCIDFLRNKFPNIQFVGTEPAIKLACNSAARNILLLATPSTVASSRVSQLIESSRRREQQITSIACTGLADLIEECAHRDNLSGNLTLLNCPGLIEPIEKEYEVKIRELFEALLENVNPDQFDSIILGCTHYILIRDLIASYFPNAKIIDGNSGIAKQTEKILINNNLNTDRETPGVVEYFYS